MIANMEVHETDRIIHEVACEKTDLSEYELDRCLEARKMTEA
jgi:aspartate ammonia-lyase